MIVFSQTCDLIKDWSHRQSASGPLDESAPQLMTHVLLCDLYEEGQLREEQKLNSTLWTPIQKNQNERYHHLTAAPVGGCTPGLPDLYLDFKKVYGLPIDNLYAGIRAGVVRVAVVPPIFLHDILHRFFGFQSRVAVPE